MSIESGFFSHNPERFIQEKEAFGILLDRLRGEQETWEFAEESLIEERSRLQEPIPNDLKEFFADYKLLSNLFLSTSLEGASVEGLPGELYLKFMQTMLEVCPNPEIFPSAVRGLLETALFVEEMYATIYSSTTLEEKLERQGAAAEAIMQKVFGLDPHDCFLMRGGYSSERGFGHDQYYLFEKQEDGRYTIYNFNAQGGVEKAQGGVVAGGEKKGIPFAYYKNVLPEEIFFNSENPDAPQARFFSI